MKSWGCMIGKHINMFLWDWKRSGEGEKKKKEENMEKRKAKLPNAKRYVKDMF